MKELVVFRYKKGVVEEVFPCSELVKNWVFPPQEVDEAILANAMADIAKKNGMDTNDLQGLFPAVLRMLKSNTSWAK